MGRTIDEMVRARDIDNEEFGEQSRKLVAAYIWKHYSYCKEIVKHMEDLMQAGIIGIMEAYRRYDEKRGGFCAYCHLYIRGEVYGVYCKDILHLSRYYAGIWFKIRKAAEQIIQRGESYTIEKLAQITNLSIRTVKNTLSQKPLL